MVSLQSPSRLVKLCVVSGAVILVSFLAYCYTSLPYFRTKCLQEVEKSQNLVTTMTAALIKMLQESTDMKPHNVTADCKNIWKIDFKDIKYSKTYYDLWTSTALALGPCDCQKSWAEGSSSSSRVSLIEQTVLSGRDQNCRPENCSKSISQNAEKRIQDLLSPKLTLNDQDRQLISYLAYLIPASDVIFTTGASSSHYDEMQAMVQSLYRVVYPRVQNKTFVVLDLGLTLTQRLKTTKSCRCLVITFPFSKVPSYFRELSFCAWKPVLIMACMMRARRLVVYQDTSIYWKDTIAELLDRGDKLGLQIWGGKDMHNIPVTTLKGTFDYFGEEPCAYLNYTSLQAGINVFKQTPFVVRTILEPWAKCALEPNCICPGCTINHLYCFKPKKEIHMCHRFDQSVLSIITTKLFSYERYRFHMPGSDLNDGRYVNINRGQKSPTYFNKAH